MTNNFTAGLKWRRATVLTAAVVTLAAGSAHADTTVFADNFEDGAVSDWLKSTNFGGTTTIATSSQSHTGNFGLETMLVVPPSSGFDLVVRASHDFSAPVAATYSFDLFARNSLCSGCTVSYEVLVDSSQVRRATSPNVYEHVSFSLALSAGQHTLTLGMHTTSAFFGHFIANFDDVLISTAALVPPPPVPEPATWALMGAGLLGLVVASRQPAKG